MECVKSDIVIRAVHDGMRSINPIRYEVEFSSAETPTIRIPASKEVNTELYECIKKLNILASKAMAEEDEEMKEGMKLLYDMFVTGPGRSQLDEVLKAKGIDPKEVDLSEMAEFMKGL